jgi:exopolysaccharide production protein ExoQ
VSSTTRLIQILFPNANFSAGPGVPSIERALEGNPTSRMIFLVLIMAAGIVLIKKRKALSAFIRANRGIYILYAYTLLSVAWSVYPDVSMKRYIKMCGCLFMAFLVASEEDQGKALEHVFRRYIAVCLALSLFFVKTDRSIGYMISVHGDHFMAGIANHKNDLGILAVYSLIFLVMRAIKSWPKINYLDTALMLVDAYFLIRARSTTALVLAFLGVALILGLKLAGSFRRIMVLVVISLIVALPILTITMNSPGSVVSGAFFSSTGKDATLTGRIPMWKDLIGFGRKNLVFGSGYESYWIRYYKEIWAKWTFLPVSAHNGFVEVMLNLGLIGLAIMLAVISRSLSLLGSEDSLSRPYGHWNLAILIIFIVSNLTESWFISMSLGWNLFLMVLTNAEKDRLMRTPSPAMPLP